MSHSMEIVHNEHAELEKAAGNFAGTMKIYNDYKNEIDQSKGQYFEDGVSLMPSSRLAIDLTEIENEPPDINTPRQDISVERKQNVPKCGSLPNIDYTDRSEKQIAQIFVVGDAKLPMLRKGRSKIPRPTNVYGSVYRDSEKYLISDIDSSKLTANNKFVSENKRYLVNPTKEIIKKENEVDRLKGIQNQTDIVHNAEKVGIDDNCGQYNVKSYDGKESDRRGTSFSHVKHSMDSLQKQAIINKRNVKKEIKSKIDTGLKNRPVNQENMCTNRKDAKKTKASVKSSTEKIRRRESSSCDVKTRSLPPLKNAHNELEIPRSPAFGNKAPLPGIQSPNEQRIKKNNVSEKKAVTPCVLPPIVLPNAGRLPAIENNNEQSKVSSVKQAPEAMWISISPTPPTNRPKPAKRRRRNPETDRSSQKDGKRVLYG